MNRRASSSSVLVRGLAGDFHLAPRPGVCIVGHGPVCQKEAARRVQHVPVEDVHAPADLHHPQPVVQTLWICSRPLPASSLCWAAGGEVEGWGDPGNEEWEAGGPDVSPRLLSFS